MDKFLVRRPAKRSKDEVNSEEERENNVKTRLPKKVKLEKKMPVKKATSRKGKQASKTSKDDKKEEVDKKVLEEVSKEDEAEESEKDTINEVAAKIASGNVSKTNKFANWTKGEPVPFTTLCKTFEAIEKETKRLIIQEYLTAFLTKVIELTPENLLQALYLCLNRICPEYENLELGVGEGILVKAIAESTGRNSTSIKKDMRALGDLGSVAKASKQSQSTLWTPKSLTIPSVFNRMKTIATTNGQESQARKLGEIKGLLSACTTGEEAKFLIRSLEGKLRIGLAEQTVLISLAQAIVLKDPQYQKLSKSAKASELAEAPNILKAVYSEVPSYDIIVPKLLEFGVKGLRKHCKLTPGIPVKPMLAHPTKSITEVLDRLEGHKFTCEFKYDGERGQIHRLENGTVKIYSRNLEDNSQKFPDILEKIPKVLKPNTKSFVIDCEVVAWDNENHCIRPFQVLSTRKRKDVKEEDITVSVCIFAFDILYLNGESLLQKPFSERRQSLYDAFQPLRGEFAFAHHMDAANIEEIQTFLDESVKDNCEGLMVKISEGPESTYEPSKRSRNWLKLKKDYLTGVGDSLDLVVIGAYLGRGKRTNLYGAFLLACYDPDNEEYQTICKIGTGFSDAVLEEHYKFLKQHEIEAPKSYYNYDKNTNPDVWFEPCQVWEVLTADLSISPVYKAAVGVSDPTKGVSLRFPRFIKVRDDKTPEDATTSEQIAEMYKGQRQFQERE
ncbi:8172_t:CDS:10 [Ambispora leptoticha]|uniref:DNA ligase n=1 Tax=Ambispora leptoticha TaxID=144679 RepID=A0A9N8ZN63_9GLOM|nr:8172_t:CDS:10 [Ambispora leptoticha]